MRFVSALCVCFKDFPKQCENHSATDQNLLSLEVFGTHLLPYSRPTCLTYYQRWLQPAGHKVKCPIRDFSTHMSVLMRNKVGEGKQKGKHQAGGGCRKRTFGNFLLMVSAVSEGRSVRDQTQITQRDNNCAVMTDSSPPQEEFISTVT